MSLFKLFLASTAFTIVAACGGGSDNSPEPEPVVKFVNSLGEEVQISVELASTPQERATGLMNRESLPENTGMLFIYTEDHQSGFWMRDTLMPLSIAFVRNDGTVVDIQDMEPQTEDLHRPDSIYRYALEANQGWFERNWITPGITAELPTEAINEQLE